MPSDPLFNSSGGHHHHQARPPSPPPSLQQPQHVGSEAALAVHNRQQKDLKVLSHIDSEISTIRNKVTNDITIEKAKVELENQVTKLQASLQGVNRHLEQEQLQGEIAARNAAKEQQRLRDEILVRDAQIQQAIEKEHDLKQEAQDLRDEMERRQQIFNEEKKTINNHFIRTGQDLHDTVQKLEQTEAQGREMESSNTALKGWLDRGVTECKRIESEREEAKQTLQRTAANWEEDHHQLIIKLSELESEHKAAVHERGALAVNLTAARQRVIEDSRNLYQAIPLLKNLIQRTLLVESSLSTLSSAPLHQIQLGINDLSDIPIPEFSEDPTSHPFTSQQVRELVSELFLVFKKMHTSAETMLTSWNGQRDEAREYPLRLAKAEEQSKSLKDTNDRLKLKLNQLRADCERWRHKANYDEGAVMGQQPPPFTRLQKQELIQAQTVAATLYREKDALEKRHQQLSREATDLRDNYNETESENTIMREEMQRLRRQIALQAAQFDQFNPLPQ